MSNSVSSFLPSVVLNALEQLSANCVTARLVRTDFTSQQGNVGETITIPAIGAITAEQVTPSATYDPSDLTNSSVSVTLQHWSAGFHLSDRELVNADQGLMPAAMQSAVVSLSNKIDNLVLTQLYQKSYNTTGTAGTTPFATTTAAATAARRILMQNNCPADPFNTFFVMDPLAEEKALGLEAFTSAAYTGQPEAAIINGFMGTKLGFGFVMNQNTPSHTAGTGSSYQTSAAATAGDTSVSVDTGSGTVLVGDIVTFAGHTQTYTVTSALTGGSFSFSPELQANVADNEAVTVTASHTANLAFHRDSAVLVQRSLDNIPGANAYTLTDDKTGMSLRAELIRQNARSAIRLDVLFGIAVARPELIVRVLG